MKQAIIALIGVALLAASGFAQARIGGIRWEMTELNGRHVKDSQVFIEFDEAARRLSGNARCNRFFGGYELRGGRLDAGRLGSTKMACSSSVMKAEARFLQALNDASQLRRNGATLTLHSRGRRVLKFQRARPDGEETRAPDLAAKKWMLRSILGNSVQFTKDAPFLNFDAAKGSAGGNSGCNVFGGDYKSSGAAIEFGNIVSTMRACEFEGRMEVERGFLEGLRNANRFEIKGARLTLLRGNRVLLVFDGIAK